MIRPGLMPLLSELRAALFEIVQFDRQLLCARALAASLRRVVRPRRMAGRAGPDPQAGEIVDELVVQLALL